MNPLAASAANLKAKAARLERAGDLTGAIEAYEAALRQAPDDPDALASLARLAERVEAHETAAKLWGRLRALRPDRLEAVDGEARACRELGRFEEAVAVLRAALMAHPQEAPLWTSLGVTLTQEGRADEALTFLSEAVRLDPKSAVALYNRGSARFDAGDLEGAQADFDAARKLARKPTDAAMIDFAAATLALARGELEAGWAAYEVRLSPHWTTPVLFDAPGRRWTPETPLAGKRLLVIGEQGIGDEIMFASVLPQVLDELGPEGRLHLAVEPRLVELFQRSFPEAQVQAHATRFVAGRARRSLSERLDSRAVDVWTPMGSLPRPLRRTLEAFPQAAGYLQPDPEQVARWRDWLGAGPPAVGITWRSGKLLGDRRRHYPPLDAWRPVVATPGVRLVNLQYGECAEELAALGGMAGRQVLQAPGLDLREDMEGLAALCGALDLVVAVGNATAQLAGACGRPLALLSGPWPWTALGSGRYPWHPSAELLACATSGAWEPVMAEAARRVAAAARR